MKGEVENCSLFSTVQARDSDEPTEKHILLKQLHLFSRQRDSAVAISCVFFWEVLEHKLMLSLPWQKVWPLIGTFEFCWAEQDRKYIQYKLSGFKLCVVLWMGEETLFWGLSKRILCYLSANMVQFNSPFSFSLFYINGEVKTSRKGTQ